MKRELFYPSSYHLDDGKYNELVAGKVIQITTSADGTQFLVLSWFNHTKASVKTLLKINKNP